ncbi:lipase family protein, partial [Nocardia tengchongensis]|uniref:lipase family protein n=1 Tax=Nocardia tengchongensis TaxID=2055889 RepID=UPI0036A6DD56
MISRFAAAAALAVALTANTPALAEDLPPAAGSVRPDTDPFYSPPPDLASYRDGQLVDHREVGVDLGIPVHAWQLSFRTNDSRDRPELGVTTVLVPTAPWSGPGRRPVVSEQLPEDSTGTRCAPSYTLVNRTVQSAEPLTQMLAKGWIVAVPDHEGPKSGFLTGPRTAHTILDGIRAVGGGGAPRGGAGAGGGRAPRARGRAPARGAGGGGGGGGGPDRAL